VTPDGELIDPGRWKANRHRWLPTADDAAFLSELMQPVYQPGEFASWIAPPNKGILGRPIEFEYVKIP
jgi:benzoyl-CoA 2,3-dioxygenase component B